MNIPSASFLTLPRRSQPLLWVTDLGERVAAYANSFSTNCGSLSIARMFRDLYPH